MANNNSKFILIVEDEVLIAVAEQMDLEKYGYNVILAHSGEEAIQTCKSNPDINLIMLLNCLMQK